MKKLLAFYTQPETPFALIFWLSVAAVSVSTYAMVEQYMAIPIHALAEDNCEYFHGAYALKEVTPDESGIGVVCWYRN